MEFDYGSLHSQYDTVAKDLDNIISYKDIKYINFRSVTVRDRRQR